MKTILSIILCAATASHAAPELAVRETPGQRVVTGSGTWQATELWLTDACTTESILLVRGSEDPAIERTIASISEPEFSPDHSHVYFVSEAWATSAAIHKVEVATKQVSFVIDGCSFKIIKSGRFAGFLVVDRHLIGENGRDSYLWLVSSDGSHRMQIGQIDSDAVMEFRKLHLLDEK